MNLSEDFINIQGIFINLEKTTGVLKRVKHRGGKEKTITQAITEVKKLLTAKNYIKDNAVNHIFNEELQNIVLFFILNTDLNKTLDEPGCQHLMNIMPQLSTCLLANLIVGLDLTKEYCDTLDRLSLGVTEELLIEMVSCLKKCKPKVCLKYSQIILQTVITKISATSDKEMDDIDQLAQLASLILLNVTGLQAVEAQDISKDLVYELMGHSLLCLLDLLLMSNEKNQLLSKLIGKLLQSASCIMKGVTIDVFCSWAEVKHEDQVLQALIAGKSFMFIEKYKKCAPAKELIEMLSTIAQRPIAVQDLIRTADVPTMITMINKVDFNQKLWFTALLNTQVLECEDSMQCVNRWAHLCTLSDVSRLLNMSTRCKNSFAKKLVIKCASTLELDELIVATTRHFYQNGIGSNLNDDVKQQTVFLFNKIKDKHIGEEFTKELHLLMLQNPRETLELIFAECIKNTFYLYNLKNVLLSLKEVAQINNIGVKTLYKEIANNVPSDQNCNNYTELFKVLVEIQFFTIENVVNLIFLPLLQELFFENKYEALKHGIIILNNLQEDVSWKPISESFCNLLFNVMSSCRCNFLHFDGLKHQVLKECVGVMEKCNSIDTERTIKREEEDIFISYYKSKLYGQDSNLNILKHFLPISFENHAETVTHLIKIIPVCVLQEWLMISSNLVTVCGVQKTIELLCDVMILICELVNSQENKTEEVKCMLNALKCCCQNFGIVIKECLQPKIHNLEEDIVLTTNICRLLRDIPCGNLRSEGGLSLANLLSDVSLKSLRNDKRFACLIASINESHICKMLAQKILQ